MSGIQSGPGGHDSGDDRESPHCPPVSIHVSNPNLMGQQHDPGPSAESHQSGQTEQRLKVEDALNYLDQVKYKFGNQPQVYNDFLDIMKEFKSQSIDTPGVISRVSNLFRGHPELIVGFNTFLPPGYKIEIQTHDQGSQISYRVDGVTNYVVNMPSYPTPTVPSSHPAISAQQQVPSNPTSQIIQHTATTGAALPVISISAISAHSTGVAATPPYGGSGGVIGGGGGVMSAGVGGLSGGLSRVGQNSNGSVSPPPGPAVTLTLSSGNKFENVVEPSPSFTHSYSSPFVQNAFPSLQSQPVQFNHAINYVNKIKNRFCGQPDKYKQFLDILHTYQKEQRNIKEGLPGKTLSEHEVYSQVSKIFENQEDLLQEFGQFLPESNQSTMVSCQLLDYGLQQRQQDIKPLLEQQPKKPAKLPQREFTSAQPAPSRTTHGQAPKRPAAAPSHAITKKPKLAAPYKEISIAEAARYGTLHDYAFFDKCRSMLKHQAVFDNFIRCLYLFNEEIISRAELLIIVQPFFCRNPEMYGWFKEFVYRKDDSGPNFEATLARMGEPPEEHALEIGEEYFSTCKRLGASYCALPKNHIPTYSSSRNTLCKEVLNDIWVSFPTWSEDSTFVTSRKTQYEEYVCRCEDERFELDVIIEANADTIRTLESVARKMARMSHEDLKQFELDDYMGGTSSVIHLRSVRRVYGDKATEIIDGLKRQPFAVVPIVLKRLKLKEDEWRESQRSFNKIWRDQVERFYLKSLDHQGITFKQSDVRMLRSKALVNEIETIYDERHDQENGDPDPVLLIGPHLTFQFSDRGMLDEACNLLLHHVRRQSGIQNDDKRKIKQLLKHFIPDLFKHARMELSDDETESGCVRDSSEDREERNKSPSDFSQNGTRNGSNKRGSTKRANAKGKKDDDDDKPEALFPKSDQSRRTAYKRALQKQAESIRNRRRSGSVGREGRSSTVKLTGSPKAKARRDKDEDKRPPRIIQAPHGDQDESYSLFYANNAWYVFLRLHQIMVERLGKMLETAAKIMQDEGKTGNGPTPAIALRMRPSSELEPSEYFPAFIDMVKNVLDGNMEASVYEDTMRELFGIHAYISYTMDKVVTNAVRQLQSLVSDEISLKFTDLLLQAQKKGGAGGPCDTAEQRIGAEITYQKQAEKIDPEENCYKIIFYHKSFRMTMELLECANIEENIAETTKWSAYIDSYTSHPFTGMDAKMKDLMKPVCLGRNVRVGYKFHSSRSYPPEIAKIFGFINEPEDIKPIIPLPGADKVSSRPLLKSDGASGVAGSSKFMLSQTLAPVTPEEAMELEKQLERNSKRRSELVQKEIEAAAAATTTSAGPATNTDPKASHKNNLATNNPVTPEEADLLEKKLEENARRRAEAAATTTTKSPYVIKENLQCKFHPNSYKMVYVVNSANYFYLKGALYKARKNHKTVSTRMNEAFGKWHQSWMENSVSEDQIMRCEDWLMSTKNSDTKIVSSNDISLAPYRPFNRYVVKK